MLRGELALLALGCVALVAVSASASANVAVLSGGQNLVLPQSAFNITDHNLTYPTNMRTLDQPWNGSFVLTFVNSLEAGAAVDRTTQEAQVAFGPGPVGPEEANITPIFILQEAASGMLRLEYIPFAMSETYGFIVYQGNVAAAGPSPFAGHTLTLTYRSSAPSISPYPVSIPYGYSTGNISLAWDAQVLVAEYPVAWAGLTAFYGYGLHTGAFVNGEMQVAISAGPSPTSAGGSTGWDSVPAWILSGTLAAGVGAVVAAFTVHFYERRSRR